MISEFQLLTQKIGKLAALAQRLRSENAQLRLEVAQLRSQNQEQAQRMQQAQERVMQLIDKLPPPPPLDQPAEEECA
ncbi:DUF904 domain-containing protein [Massilia sp. W12]|uniref:DUF904 domain-containing protein n=1 Tax=Massilia sp. W12 TaxID=3126507 RepID=UPI0030CE1A94